MAIGDISDVGIYLGGECRECYRGRHEGTVDENLLLSGGSSVGIDGRAVERAGCGDDGNEAAGDEPDWESSGREVPIDMERSSWGNGIPALPVGDVGDERLYVGCKLRECYGDDNGGAESE